MVVWKWAILRSFGGKLESKVFVPFAKIYWYLIFLKYINRRAFFYRKARVSMSTTYWQFRVFLNVLDGPTKRHTYGESVYVCLLQ